MIFLQLRCYVALLRQCIIYRGYRTISVPSFLKNTHSYGDKIAISDEYGHYSYSSVFKSSICLASTIQKYIGKDKQEERVAILCPNNVSFIVANWASWILGHLTVPLSPLHPALQIKYYLKDSQCSVILTTKNIIQKAEWLDHRKLIVINDDLSDLTDDVNDFLSKLSCNDISYSDLSAMMLYTSGTTGPPKGVVLTHSNISAIINCLVTSWGWSDHDVMLHCLPVNHLHGIAVALLCPLHIGARVIMLPKFDAKAVWDHFLNTAQPVSVFMGVPTIYAKLIEFYKTHLSGTAKKREYVKAVCKQNIRLMVSGSAHLSETFFYTWKEITGHELLERYGMTEIGMALSNPLNGVRKPGFVGLPLPTVDAKIVQFAPSNEYKVVCCGNENGTVIAPDMEEQIGELLVKGPSVFKEYWQKSDITRKEFLEDGWFKTGDTFQYKDGYYKFLGRSSSDIIKSGGVKISALDIERQLLSHPSIGDVAVVGLPDITWGQKVAAVITWTDEEPFNYDKLKLWCKERMPHYQIPSIICTADSIPRNVMGKVNKKEISSTLFK